ncbi:MAG: DUF5809 family protein [Halodesulfurarchaeum sp.]
METRGHLSPATEDAVRETYESLAGAAETVTKEIAEANAETREDYRELTDSGTVETARQALFASLLEVQVGTVAEYESWLAEHDELEPELAGTEPVSGRAWHPVWARDAVVAASFEDRPDAAVGAVQRQAFGRHYRSILEAR